MEIFEKRGRWCLRDESGNLHKFATEEEAKSALGWVTPVEETLSKIETSLDGSEKEKESSKEKTSTNK